MLLNTSRIETPLTTLLRKLDESSSSFYLTGSRYFGGATPKSDWDFFTKDFYQTEAYLVSLGFKLINDKAYNDTLTSRVFRHELGVDVQLVSDPERKEKAQKLLHATGCLRNNKDKGVARSLWNKVIALL
jgi:hypothetical protein